MIKVINVGENERGEIIIVIFLISLSNVKMSHCAYSIILFVTKKVLDQHTNFPSAHNIPEINIYIYFRSHIFTQGGISDYNVSRFRDCL